MAMLQQYAPKDVVVSFDGVNITGFSEDSMISVTRNDDMVSEVVGAQGDLQLTVNHNNTGEITFTLLQNSPSNLNFEEYFMAEQGDNFSTISMITIAVPSVGLTISCSNAYMKSIPDFTFGSDNNDREWMFGCAEIAVLRELV